MEHASLLGHSSSLLGTTGGVKAEKVIFSSVLGIANVHGHIKPVRMAHFLTCHV